MSADPDGSGRLPITLDAGHREFLAALSGAGQPRDRSLAELRSAAAAARLKWQAGGPRMDAVREHAVQTQAGPVRIRVHHPVRNDLSPAIVYLHGGGWTLLGIDTHDRIMRELAALSGWAVIGIEVPRAPETPFPGALWASLEVMAALRADPARFGISSELAVAGDFSGANLALAVALELRDRGAAPPAGLVLFYGVYDHDLTRPSYAAFGEPPLTLSAERMAWFWDCYCRNARDRDNPLASPLRADLGGLPPTRLVVAGQDVLRDENLAMAVRLAEAGNAVSLDFYPHAPHAFVEALALSDMGGTALRRAAVWLNDLRPTAGGAGAE